MSVIVVILTVNFSIMWYFPLVAKDLVSRLMEPDPDRRFTCKEALVHPWYACLILKPFLACPERNGRQTPPGILNVLCDFLIGYQVIQHQVRISMGLLVNR